MAKAGRLHVPLDVHYYHDSRVVSLSPLAELLWVRTLCLAKQLLTDGRMTRPQLLRLGLDLSDNGAEVLIDELVKARLLEGVGTDELVVHEWLAWNPAREHIEAKSEAKREAGRLGGLKSGEARRSRKSSDQGVEANVKQARSTLLRDGEASANTESESESETEKTVRSLCVLLADLVEGHSGLRPRVSQAWTKHMDYLVRLGPQGAEKPDGWTPERVERGMRRIFAELATPQREKGFCWASQVQSPESLRRHWTQIATLLAPASGNGHGPAYRTVDPV